MNILGISAGFHDAGITLIDDGEIKFAAHSERYSKIKHDKDLNVEMLNDCFSRYGTPQRIAYYERPWLKKTRQLYAGQYKELFKPGIKHQLEQIWPREAIPKIEYYGHHQSHAAAGFQTSPYDDATVVVIDAIGELDTITIWDARYDHGGKARYTKLYSKKYPDSIGLFYSAMTERVGLRPLDEEYILMGMAAYGEPKYFNQIDTELFENINEISLKQNLHIGVSSDFLPDANHMDIASSSQKIVEYLIMSVMGKARHFGRSKNLVYGSGVALNCLAN